MFKVGEVDINERKPAAGGAGLLLWMRAEALCG